MNGSSAAILRMLSKAIKRFILASTHTDTWAMPSIASFLNSHLGRIFHLADSLGAMSFSSVKVSLFLCVECLVA